MLITSYINVVYMVDWLCVILHLLYCLSIGHVSQRVGGISEVWPKKFLDQKEHYFNIPMDNSELGDDPKVTNQVKFFKCH